MRRLLLIAILGVVLISLVFFFVTSSFRIGNSGDGAISIQTLPSDMVVRIDGEEVGKSPIDSYTVSAGDHIVEIGTTWQEKVSVAEGVSSTVWRDLSYTRALSYGYSVGYETITSILRRETQYVFTSTPAGAEVLVDGVVVGTTPLVLDPSKITSDTVQLRDEGYNSIDVPLSSLDSVIVRIDVLLQSDPFASLHKIQISSEALEGVEVRDPIVAPRSSWGGTPIYKNDSQLQLAPWERIEVWSVDTKPESVSEYVQALDSLFAQDTEYPGIPFAYIIDQNMNVYEGAGVYDYDFGVFNVDQLSIPSNVAPILLLGSKSSLSEQQLETISSLRKYIEQEQPVRASIVSQIGEIELNGGDTRILEVTVVNTSPVTWNRGGEHNVAIVPVQRGIISELYDPSTWGGVDIAATLSDDVVYPGATTTYAFTLRAPYYSSTITEQYALFDLTREVFVEDTQFDVSVTVVSDNARTVRIKDTPTGFLNVRSGPGVGFKLLTTVFPGEKVALIQEQEEWYQIILRDGTRGWVIGSYIEVL